MKIMVRKKKNIKHKLLDGMKKEEAQITYLAQVIAELNVVD